MSRLRGGGSLPVWLPCLHESGVRMGGVRIVASAYGSGYIAYPKAYTVTSSPSRGFQPRDAGGGLRAAPSLSQTGGSFTPSLVSHAV